jgi:hypothetical protein
MTVQCLCPWGHILLSSFSSEQRTTGDYIQFNSQPDGLIFLALFWSYKWYWTLDSGLRLLGNMCWRERLQGDCSFQQLKNLSYLDPRIWVLIKVKPRPVAACLVRAWGSALRRWVRAGSLCSKPCPTSLPLFSFMSDTTENVAQRVAFHDLALLCERISVSAKGGGGKSKLFTSFLQHWRNVHATLHADEAQTVKLTE